MESNNKRYNNNINIRIDENGDQEIEVYYTYKDKENINFVTSHGRKTSSSNVLNEITILKRFDNFLAILQFYSSYHVSVISICIHVRHVSARSIRDRKRKITLRAIQIKRESGELAS